MCRTQICAANALALVGNVVQVVADAACQEPVFAALVLVRASDANVASWPPRFDKPKELPLA